MIKVRVLLLFIAVLCVAKSPTAIAWVFGAGIAVRTCWGLLTVFLSIILPLYVSRKWDSYASFDKTVLPEKLKHYFLIPLLVVLLLAVSIPIGYLLHQLKFPKPVGVISNQTLLYLNWFVLIVLGPVSEEIFWRGYALDQFRKLGNNAAALLLSAVLFTIMHIPAVGIHSIQLFGWGILLGYWRIRYRALLPLIIAHALANALVMLPIIIDSVRS